MVGCNRAKQPAFPRNPGKETVMAREEKGEDIPRHRQTTDRPCGNQRERERSRLTDRKADAQTEKQRAIDSHKTDRARWGKGKGTVKQTGKGQPKFVLIIGR